MDSQVSGVDASTTKLSSAADPMREEALLLALARAEAGLDAQTEQTPPVGDEYLLVWLGLTPCFVLLNQLREALLTIPTYSELPFSPTWMWGIFPLRTDLVALVDPWPVLSGHETNGSIHPPMLRTDEALRALVVGEGEHLLALLVTQVGAIHVFGAAERLEPMREQHPMIAPDYVTGAFVLDGSEQVALCLDISRLMEDILVALEEKQAHE